MTGQNAGKIMPADSIRPCFDERLDLGFRRLALLHHGCCSEYWLVSAPRTNVGAHIRHASKLFRGGARSSVLPRFDIVAAGAIDRGEHAGERAGSGPIGRPVTICINCRPCGVSALRRTAAVL